MASVIKRSWTYKGVTKSAWHVRWTDVEGIRRGKTFGSKAEAELFCHRVGGPGRGQVFEPDMNEATVGFAAKAYVKWMLTRVADGRCSADYLDSKERRIDFYIVKRLGSLRISNLTLHTLTQWHAGVKRTRDIEAGTARDIALLLKRIVAFAHRRQWVTFNPVDALLDELRGIPKKRVRAFSPDEMTRLLSVIASGVSKASTDYQRRVQSMLQCYVHLGAFCGLRAGEIAGLDLDHIDFEHGLVRVEYNMLPSGKRKAPKSAAGTRTVPMPAHLAEMLKAWLAEHSLPRNELAKYIQPDHRRLVFLTRQGRPVGLSGGVYTRWKDALAKAGLSDGDDQHHFHATRHFFASWLLSKGGSPADTAALMGHSNPAMTLSVYARPMAPIEHAVPIQSDMAAALIAPPTPLLRDMRDAA